MLVSREVFSARSTATSTAGHEGCGHLAQPPLLGSFAGSGVTLGSLVRWSSQPACHRPSGSGPGLQAPCIARVLRTLAHEFAHRPLGPALHRSRLRHSVSVAGLPVAVLHSVSLSCRCSPQLWGSCRCCPQHLAVVHSLLGFFVAVVHSVEGFLRTRRKLALRVRSRPASTRGDPSSAIIFDDFAF